MNLSVNCFRFPKSRLSPWRKFWKTESTLFKLVELEEFLIGQKMGFGDGMNLRRSS